MYLAVRAPLGTFFSLWFLIVPWHSVVFYAFVLLILLSRSSLFHFPLSHRSLRFHRILFAYLIFRHRLYINLASPMMYPSLDLLELLHCFLPPLRILPKVLILLESGCCFRLEALLNLWPSNPCLGTRLGQASLVQLFNTVESPSNPWTLEPFQVYTYPYPG